MSIDIDLVNEENGVAVSLLHSDGIYRIFTSKTKDGKLYHLRLSPPIPTESLRQIKMSLENNFDIDEYQEAYEKAVARQEELSYNV